MEGTTICKENILPDGVYCMATPTETSAVETPNLSKPTETSTVETPNLRKPTETSTVETPNLSKPTETCTRSYNLEEYIEVGDMEDMVFVKKSVNMTRSYFLVTIDDDVVGLFDAYHLAHNFVNKYIEYLRENIHKSELVTFLTRHKLGSGYNLQLCLVKKYMLVPFLTYNDDFLSIEVREIPLLT